METTRKFAGDSAYFRQFEDALLELGGERELILHEKREIISLLDEPEDEEIVAKNIIENILDSVLDEYDDDDENDDDENEDDENEDDEFSANISTPLVETPPPAPTFTPPPPSVDNNTSQVSNTDEGASTNEGIAPVQLNQPIQADKTVVQTTAPLQAPLATIQNIESDNPETIDEHAEDAEETVGLADDVVAPSDPEETVGLTDDVVAPSDPEENLAEEPSEFTLPLAYQNNIAPDSSETQVLPAAAPTGIETLMAESNADFDPFDTEDDLSASPESQEELSQIFEETATLLNEDIENIGSIDYSSDELSKMYQSDAPTVKKKGKYRTQRLFQKSDEIDFLRKLNALNIYLQDAILQAIANETIEDNLQRLIDLILDEAPTQKIHYEIERVLGAEVEFLKDSNIYTVDTLKETLSTPLEKVRSVSMLVFTRIIPIAAAITFVSISLYLLAILPTYSRIVYKNGYEQLRLGNTERSEELFVKATEIYPIDKFFFSYADLYNEKRFFNESKKKYEQLIFGVNPKISKQFKTQFLETSLYNGVSINNKIYVPLDEIYYSHKAFIKIAEHELYKDGNFETTRKYYNLWIETHSEDYQMKTLLADLYIEWYDYTGKEIYLDFAKSTYDRIAYDTNYIDSILVHRIRWAIRANDTAYVNEIMGKILGSDFDIKIPQSEIIPYLEFIALRLDNEQIAFTGDILDNLASKHPYLPDLPYLYAKYFSLSAQYDLEEPYIQNSITSYAQQDFLSRKQVQRYVDSYILLAEKYLYRDNNLLAARDAATNAQILYESRFYQSDIFRNKNASTIALHSDIRRLYFLRSQIELLAGNITETDSYIKKTIESGYKSAMVSYHMGVNYYLQKNWELSSLNFLKAIEDDTSFYDNTSRQAIIYLALANSQLFGEEYTSAAVYYKKLLDIIENDITPINILQINLLRQTDVYTLQENKAKTMHNLGIALYHMSTQGIINNKTKNKALITLQNSNATFQNINRDEDYIRNNTINAADLSIQSILQQDTEYSYAAFSDIPYFLDDNHLKYDKNTSASFQVEN